MTLCFGTDMEKGAGHVYPAPQPLPKLSKLSQVRCVFRSGRYIGQSVPATPGPLGVFEREGRRSSGFGMQDSGLAVWDVKSEMCFVRGPGGSQNRHLSTPSRPRCSTAPTKPFNSLTFWSSGFIGFA